MNKNPQDEVLVLDELRQLLLGSEIKKLGQISDKLESPDLFSSQIGEVLPQAMQKSAEHGEQLSEAMVPTVEEIVRLSIKRDINKFANALFPVIGPAIRKSIAETIRQMMESLNQTLEYGLSWKGIKWRIESMRTGIPFAQIVLLNSFDFRVEQVFLIHRESGLLLNHVELEHAQNQNADMVSSMLSAIGDFVGDSFEVENKQALDSIQVGDFSILIEQAPGAILAVAIRGEAPKKLRNTMQQILEDIQKQFDQQLMEFKGDTTAFESSRGQLLLCMMQSRQKAEKKKIPLKTKLILLIVFILFFYWIASNIYLSIQQKDYISLLEKEPGIIITQVLHEGDTLSIKGLRDPLSRDPEKFVALSTLDPEDISYHFEPYQSLEKQFVKKRLNKILNPPQNVSTIISGRQLTITGYANEEKIMSIKMMAPLIAGIDQVDTSKLSSNIDLTSLNTPESVELNLDINTGHLVATGTAIRSWQNLAREQVSKIPGVRSYDDSALKNILDLSILNPPESVSMILQNGILKITGHADNNWILSTKAAINDSAEIQQLDLSQFQNNNKHQLNNDIESLQKEMIFFDFATSFNYSSSNPFDRVSSLVNKIIQNANMLSLPVKIVIKGHSDSIGQFQDNVFLSIERADYVAQQLFITGISPEYVLIKGLDAPVAKERSIAEQSYNRRVSFEVLIEDRIK